MTAKPVWTVPARVVRVIDGDTIVADLDLGWSTWRLAQRIRVLGIDCPEMNTEAGKAAKAFTEEALADTGAQAWAPITVRSQALDNFGRVLGDVLIGPDPAQAVSLADVLLRYGHAVRA